MMSRIFNIELGDDFFRQAARIIKGGFSDHVIVVPNRRSVRELKRELLRDNANTIVPKIISLSDYVRIDEDLITFTVFGILRAVYVGLPANILFDFSRSICNLVKEFVSNNVCYYSLCERLPNRFAEHWKVTESILNNVFCDDTIKRVVEFSIERIDTFLSGLDKILVVGVDVSCYWGRRLACAALRSSCGGVVLCGMERECENRALFCEIVQNKEKVTNVPRETCSGIVEEIVCSCREEECFAVGVAVGKYIHDNEEVLIVCPEQSLSRQIQGQLMRWGIVADSSVGENFWQTFAGLLMRGALKVVECNYDVDSVICLLKLNRGLQSEVLRIESFFRKRSFVKRSFFDEIEAVIHELSPEIQEIVEELKKNEALNGEQSFLLWFEACARIVECIDPGCVEEIKRIARGVLHNAYLLPSMNASEFVSLFVRSLSSQMIGVKSEDSGKVHIVGAIEAQLLHADRVIIVEANEASWCCSGEENSLLGRGMRKELGLPDGESVNVFLQCVFERLFFKPNVLVTRALRVEGVPQTPYCLYNRLCCVRQVKQAYWLNRLLVGFRKSQPRENVEFIPPRPPLEKRPVTMCATDVEALFNNPYGYYAKRILRLSKVNHINDLENIRGKCIHEILYDFVVNRRANVRLEEVSSEYLRSNGLSPVHFGIWYFRMTKIFKFVESNMPQLGDMFCEIDGGVFISLGENVRVKIASRADRLDVSHDGKITIVDYKTGAVPTKSSVVNGVKPQLLIEAFIGKKQGFFKDKFDVVNLNFWKLDGKQDGGSVVCIAKDANEVAKLVDEFSEKLTEKLIKYNVNGEGYECNTKALYDEEYKHLARVKEWTGA